MKKIEINKKYKYIQINIDTKLNLKSNLKLYII